MKTQRFTLKSLAVAALLCTASAAQADITVYTSQAAFLAAVSAPGVDSYNDLSPQLYDSTLNRMAGGYSYSAYAETGLFGVGGGGDSALSTNVRMDPITFSTFSPGVSAFGGNFYATDAGGNFVTGNMVLTASDGTTLTYTLNDATTNSFVGFVSTAPLQSITLGTDGGLYWPSADNVTLALAVPEPATYGMMLGGLGLFGLLARRRRAALVCR